MEDFCAIAYAVENDLKLLPRTLLQQPDVKSILKWLDKDKWFTILRYAPLEKLPLNSDEKNFLNQMRTKNLEVLDTLFLRKQSRFLFFSANRGSFYSGFVDITDDLGKQLSMVRKLH